MSSCNLRCFIDAFGSGRTSIHVPLFLAPRAIKNKSETLSYGQGQRPQPIRQLTSITPAKPSVPRQRLYHSYVKHEIPVETNLPDSALHQNPVAWIRRLETFLPPELRDDKSAIIEGSDQGITSKPVHKLVQLLREARSNKHFEIDLLSYLGVRRGRWQAVIWLVRAISNSCHAFAGARKRSERLYTPQWIDSSPPLHELTKSAIWADDLIRPFSGTTIKLKELTERGHSGIDHEGTGQIWQSLGHMVLQAADRRLEDPNYNVILSHVFQILAHMHHIGAVPELIYKHNPTKDPFIPTRPPTLEVLSTRIMAVLSDSTLRADNSAMLPGAMQIDAEDAYNTHDLSQASLHELGVGVWLDLILWVCLDGGWIAEAASIVNEIDKRKNDVNRNWSVNKWDSAHDSAPPKSSRRISLGDVIARSRLDQIAGGDGISRHSRNTPFVYLAPRSISREVVLVLMDALVSTLIGTESDNDDIESLEHSIGTCKRLLATDGHGIDSNTSNHFMLRLIDSEVSSVMHTPERIGQIMQLCQTSEIEKPGSRSENSPHDFMTTNSALSLGLLRQMLFCFTTTDDIQGALESFRKLQELRDLESQKVIKDFILKVQQSNLRPSRASGIAEVKFNENAFLYHSLLPNHVLAAFLGFVTRVELWDLAKWIIYSSDADGPIVSPDLYSDPSLQPALIRFATATSDTQLLAKVTEKLKTPLSHSNLQALLHCQTSLGNWNSVEELLLYFRDEPKMRWDASDAMKIASAILYMERDVSKSEALLSQAMSILQKLLSGQYNSSHKQIRGWGDKSQILLANQIGRILLDIPGKLSTLVLPSSIHDRRVNLKANIPPDAFNIILKGIVDCNGSVAGKKSWDRWCETNKLKAKYGLRSDELNTMIERVVEPNLRTLRIIIQPLVKTQISARKYQDQTEIAETETDQPLRPRKTNGNGESLVKDGKVNQLIMSNTSSITQEDRDLLEWAVRIYKSFGLSDMEIELEIPKHLHQPDDGFQAVT